MLNLHRLRRRIFCLLYVLSILSALALCLASCSTARHASSEHHLTEEATATHQADTLARHARADTSRTALLLRDTILYRDTTRVSEFRRGDTVYVQQWHTRYHLQRQLVHDTVFRYLSDTTHLATHLQRQTSNMKTSQISKSSSSKRGGPPWDILLPLIALCVMYVAKTMSVK